MSTDAGLKYVKTPFRRRFRLWRQRFMPLLIWIAALGTVFMLFQRQQLRIDAVGIVETTEGQVAPLFDGVLGEVKVKRFESVKAGDVVAVMSDAIIASELKSARAELARLKLDVYAQAESFKLDLDTFASDELNGLRRFMMNELEARLDYRDRIVSQETDKVTLERLNVQLARVEKSLRESLVDPASYDDIRLQRDALQVKIKENVTAIEIAKQNFDAAVQRRIERERQAENNQAVNDVNMLVAPLKAQISVQEALVEQIVERGKTLVLKAPVDGKVSDVLHQAGESVMAGDMILTITAPTSSFIRAFVHESGVTDLTIGTPVEIFTRSREQVFKASIVEVGSRIELLPTRLWRNPLTPQRGLAILVGEVPAGIFIPGETVDLTFLPESP